MAEGKGKPGEVIRSRGMLTVATGDGAIEILSLQFPGKKQMAASAYLAGNPIAEHTVFGG